MTIFRLLLMIFIIAVAAMPLGEAAAAYQASNDYSDCSTLIDSGRAAEVIRTYYRALTARHYRTAYLQWANGGLASGQNFDDFSRGFAQTRSTFVQILFTQPPEGAAGSVFVTISVQVDARLGNGKRQRFAGTYLLRRINDIPGATPDQLQWHIQSADLRPVRP